MTDTQTNNATRAGSWSVYIAIILLASVIIFFFIEFTISSQGGAVGTSDEDLTASTYMNIVNPLLEDADPTGGAELVQTLGCNSCHMNETTQIGPPFTGVANRAQTRRPPLTAAAYLYESIIAPGAFVVEGYNNNMPRTYGGEGGLTTDQIGDILAYLLTLNTS